MIAWGNNGYGHPNVPGGLTGVTDAGLSGPDAAEDAMPHGDLPNLLKYAFNLNLAGADSHTLIPGSGESGLPVIVSETSGGTIRLEFVRRIGSGLIYEPQKSPDLSEGSWAAVATTPTVLPIDGQWERVIIEEPLNAGTMRWFGRVRVTLPP